MSTKSIAVILSGCGRLDGSEVHEATLTLWAIHKNGADYQCYAPNVAQSHVMNHISGEPMEEQRNVLIESARIARGDILDLADFQADSHDALILPGGLGAVTNLSDYAQAGASCKVNHSLEDAILAMAASGKPIGALCIAPTILAKVLGKIRLTIGQDHDTAAALESMGATHSPSLQTEVVIDTVSKIVSTPCYMLEARVDQIGESADRLVKEVLKMMDKDTA